MTQSHGEGDAEPVTVTDKRRIDPDTGEVRESAETSAPAPSGPGSEDQADSAEAAELKADLQRLKAEYDNYRKRSLRDQQAAIDRAKESVVTALLPVLDDLDRARAHGDLESGPLKAVADKLTGTLESLGLKSFGVEGDVFDPEQHEAVQHDGDGSNPVLGAVMRQGYKFGEKVVRHAMVGVVDTVAAADNTAEPGASAGTEAAES